MSDFLRHPESHISSKRDAYVVCRLGNDSQIAADALRKVVLEGVIVKDLIGGLRAWSNRVDAKFPVY